MHLISGIFSISALVTVNLLSVRERLPSFIKRLLKGKLTAVMLN